MLVRAKEHLLVVQCVLPRTELDDENDLPERARKAPLSTCTTCPKPTCSSSMALMVSPSYSASEKRKADVTHSSVEPSGW